MSKAEQGPDPLWRSVDRLDDVRLGPRFPPLQSLPPPPTLLHLPSFLYFPLHSSIRLVHHIHLTPLALPSWRYITHRP